MIDKVWEILKEEWKNPLVAIWGFLYGLTIAFFFFVGVQSFLWQNTDCKILDQYGNVEMEAPYFVTVYHWNNWVVENNKKTNENFGQLNAMANYEQKSLYCNLNLFGVKI